MLGDPNVMTVGLEEWADDFNATAADVAQFLTGAQEDDIQILVNKAQVGNTHTNNGHSANHVNSADKYKQAMGIIEDSNDPIWDEVRAFRETLGYSEVSPGVWRINVRDGAKRDLTNAMKQLDYEAGVFASVEAFAGETIETDDADENLGE